MVPSKQSTPNPEEQIAEIVRELDELAGFHSSSDITLADILLKNPGIRTEQVALLTHPFFNLRGDYESKLSRFIEGFQFPIVVLSYDIEADSRRIGALSSHQEHIYLKCGYQIAVPTAGWDITASVINGFFARKVLLGGANLSYDEFRNPCQCVGFIYRNLKDKVPNLRLYEEICNM